MKIARFLPTLALLTALTACKKDPVTEPVQFTETSYGSLGNYDSSGRPVNLLPRDTIKPAMQEYIKTTLPEKSDLRTSNPELLTTKAIADIAITQSSEVLITFVSQRTNVSNAIAFYTYPTATPPASAADIKQITYIFPNAGLNTKLKAGDKVNIGRFNPGTSIGFVLMQNAWNGTSATLNNDAVHFCSNDVLNPEVDPNLKKHAVLINYPAENKVLIGFEDINRTDPKCDHDFNDVVIYATVK